MHCPSTASDLTECHSSGWGNDAQCEYESVLWLTCTIFETSAIDLDDLDCQDAIDEQTKICNMYGKQSEKCQNAHTVCVASCQPVDCSAP